MRLITYGAPGDSSVLRLVERSIPEPGAGEVRVRAHASGVNPTDWKSRKGTGTASASADETVSNQDGSGVLDAIDDGVTGVSVGDRVWLGISGWQRPLGGTPQDYTLALAARAFPLPDEADFDFSASLGVPAVTAHRALTVGELIPTRRSKGSLEGATVLVAGGAGAVGHAAIQLARWAGATVITTVSTRRRRRSRRRPARTTRSTTGMRMLRRRFAPSRLTASTTSWRSPLARTRPSTSRS